MQAECQRKAVRAAASILRFEPAVEAVALAEHVEDDGSNGSSAAAEARVAVQRPAQERAKGQLFASGDGSALYIICSGSGAASGVLYGVRQRG